MSNHQQRGGTAYFLARASEERYFLDMRGVRVLEIKEG